MEEGGIVEGLGKTFWEAAMGDRQEYAIKIGVISRKIIGHYCDCVRVSSSVLHVVLQRVSTEHKGFSEV